MIAGSREPQHAQSNGGRDDLLSLGNGGQVRSFGAASGHALGIEAKPGQSHKQEGEPNDGEEKPDPALESEDLSLEFLRIPGDDLGRDDRALAATNPACSGRAWNTEVGEQHRVAFFAHQVAKAMVIGATTSGERHASRSVRWGHWASQPKGAFLSDSAIVAVATPGLQNVVECS